MLELQGLKDSLRELVGREPRKVGLSERVKDEARLSDLVREPLEGETSLGGFVPELNADGYKAVGIDPAAPEGPEYQQTEFERADLPDRVDAVVASTSLHHVADPSAVLDRVAGALATDGLVIVVEWDWEAFDEGTARWCLARAIQPDGWLRRRLDAWTESGVAWERAFQGWAIEHGLHSARQIVRDPSSIAIGVVLPLLLVLLFGYGMSLDVTNVPVAVVLEDPSPEATELAAGFELSPYLYMQFMEPLGATDGSVEAACSVRRLERLRAGPDAGHGNRNATPSRRGAAERTRRRVQQWGKLSGRDRGLARLSCARPWPRRPLGQHNADVYGGITGY